MNNKYIYLGDYKIAPYNPDKDGAYIIISNDVVEVVKEPTHSWEINQILVEDVDLKLEIIGNLKDKTVYTVAIPIKLNTQYSEQK